MTSRNVGMILLAALVTMFAWLGFASALEVFITVGGWLAEHTLMAYPALSTLVVFAFNCYVIALAIWSFRKVRRMETR